MLDTANREEQATKNPPLPRWFFIVQALALAVALMAQALPMPYSAGITALGIVTVIAVGVRSVYYRPGYGFVAPDGPSAFPYLITVLVGAGVPAVLAVSLETGWPWLVAGGLAAAATLDMGRRYRKAVGHD